ncbi:DUF1963 domain-containing protein [Stenotrophomonas sp. ATCM1_4]|uniref:DUF1963 domain-containing protein n=1 Tax=Stenotrophomonas sp. ATCM1_4 TaxID=2259330 RepID=UPI0010476CA3|nr:DUF1963 domain-containing protein [Stenotrophomonas sp. ATCM1_4]TDB27037.1 DUF1963 domain-containing protein [Stenotrophomonas sp. ATCM1_4]
MTPHAAHVLKDLRSRLRPAAVARVGGFRPPEDPTTSWFCRAVGLPGETVPQWQGEPMFPLLQVRVSELPVVPEALAGIALLVLFLNRHEYPFDRPHGEGWLIREYTRLEGLVPLQADTGPFRPFPIAWNRIDDDAPGWEDAWELVDLGPVNDDEAASNAFFNAFSRYGGTKFGGYPTEIQHGVGLQDYVFQVASEEKVGWMWADNGRGYFFRTPSGDWRWACQFY